MRNRPVKESLFLMIGLSINAGGEVKKGNTRALDCIKSVVNPITREASKRGIYREVRLRV